MKMLERILISLVAGVALVAAGGYGAYRYMNRTPAQLVAPNYFEYYKNHDRVPEGRVGIFISHLVMPEDYRQEDFYLLALKAKQYIPWPIKLVWDDDRGVLLLDPERPYEFESFEPKRLVDADGRDRDHDGIPYVVKYREGEVEWIEPNPSLHLDHGYFLLTSRQGGMPTVSAKLANKARTYYHGIGIKGHKIPHEAGMRVIVEAAMEQVQARYGAMPWRWVTADNFGLARDAMFELLDEGVDTVILAAPAPIYSHHEEFNGAIKHAMHYIHEWQEAHGGKPIKVIIQPQLGDFPVIRQAWVAMLKDRLDTLPKTAAVKVAMSIHGMAWDRVPHEAWIELAPAYRDTTLADLKALLESYGFARTEIVLAQDHFADPINNPNGKYLSTNKAFLDGIRDDFDYVINVPIEFFAENTDTLFSHAMFNFEHIPGYDRYEQVDYPDWTVPYTREYVVEGTRIIYNGVPVGRYNGPIIAAFVEALDSVLSAGSSPAPARSTSRSPG
jgi:protoheme ferro-lyase